MYFRSLLLQNILHKHSIVRSFTQYSNVTKTLDIYRSYYYVSFYNYINITNKELPSLQRRLQWLWTNMNIRGRIYLANEGINAQLIVPQVSMNAFQQKLQFEKYVAITNVFQSARIDVPQDKLDDLETCLPFHKLHIRIRDQLVNAKGSNEVLALDMINGKCGSTLSPMDWHKKLQVQDPNTLILDIRNSYEYDVGRFKGAISLNVNTYRDSFKALDEIINVKDIQDNDIMLYCTGGIRCEKVGAYLAQTKGLKNIYKLQGGINNYVQFLSDHPAEESNFQGRNFVFDNRCIADNIQERQDVVTKDVLSACSSCQKPWNIHRNCSNVMCGSLILLCVSCAEKFSGACSEKCQKEVLKMQDMSHSKAQAYRKKNAGKFMRVVPNAPRKTFRNIQGQHSYSVLTKQFPSLDGSYADVLSSRLSDMDEGKLLVELRNETITNFDGRLSQQLIEEHQGKLLTFLVACTGAKRVLEIGCFTGYSALCLANGFPMPPNTQDTPIGITNTEKSNYTVMTCDIDENSLRVANRYFQQSKRKEQIQSVECDGMQVLNNLQGSDAFDLIFVDANKKMYQKYYDAILDFNLLQSNGLLLFDNTLFRGQVSQYWRDVQLQGNTMRKFSDAESDDRTSLKTKKSSKIVASIAEFNMYINQDPRTEQIVLPMWDGLTLVRLVSSA